MLLVLINLLVWNEDNQGVWRATQFREVVGGQPVDVANTQILPFGAAQNVLVITLAGGNFVVAAQGETLNWDQPATNFTVTVTNPPGANVFINAVGSPMTAIDGDTTADVTQYNAQAATPPYAANTASSQEFRVTATGQIRSDEVAGAGNDNRNGGTAGATVPFVLSDGNNAGVTAAWTTTWRNCGHRLVVDVYE